jgi:hypothetical protein
MDLKKNNVGLCGLDSSGSVQKPVETSFAQGSEPSGYMRFWEIVE